MLSVAEIIEDAEISIRQGQSKAALRLVQGLISVSKSLSEAELIKIGNIFRRCGEYGGTLKILHSLVRSETQQTKNKSLAQIEYAAALVQLGLVSEARELLAPLNPNLFPEAQMHQALGLFQEWNYSKAVPLLENWVQHPNINEYRRLVGQINLNIAYAFAAPEKLQLSEIDKIETTIRKHGYSLLIGPCAQIRGRYLIEHGDYLQASLIFENGLREIKDVTTWDRLYLLKWNLVGMIKKEGAKKKWLNAMIDLKTEACGLKDFETVRDCDYLIATYFRKKVIANYCYHGTPFQSFRQRFDTKLVSNEIDFFVDRDGIQSHLDSQSQKKVVLVHAEQIASAFSIKNEKKLTSGGILERTFQALLSDFYRPMTLQRLFGIIYQGMYWNQNTSPVQVRQVLFRLRQWLLENKWDMRVQELDGRYRLVSSDKMNYQIHKSSSRLTPEQKMWNQLLAIHRTKSFSFASFQTAVKSLSKQKVSSRTQRRWISVLLREGLLEKTGNTRSAVFKLVVPSKIKV